MNTRRIAISDIHGCAKTFKALVENQVQLSKKDELYLLGDYIDRGPDSKGVIDYMLDLKAAGYQLFCLKGNHEDMMQNSLKYEDEMDFWYINGGNTTLTSFDTAVPEDIPEKYWNFMNSLEYYLEVEDYLLVHAGFNFKSKYPLEDQEAMLWRRNWLVNLNLDWLGSRIIVHGHTPNKAIQIRQSLAELHKMPVLDIDAGCYAYQVEGMGQLCAFDLSHKKLFFCPNLDMPAS